MSTADDRELLILIFTVDLFVFGLFVAYWNRSPITRQGDRIIDTPSGTEPYNKGQGQPDEKISQCKKGHCQIHDQSSKRYYAIADDALCWLWQHRPDAHQILALATVILVIIGYWTLVDIEVTLERSERAWIGPTDVKIDAAPQEGRDVKITVGVRNTGKEPAIDFFGI
jgi:hypothetical protein